MGDRAGRHQRGEHLYLPGNTILHRLPAHLKILSAFVTIVLIVVTPPERPVAFAGYLAVIVAIVALARIPVVTVLRRLTIELPFVAFALLLPLLGRDPRIPVGPLELSQPGLWAAWNILAKATLAMLISITLAATTSSGHLVIGLQRFRVPSVLVQILSAMLRYAHVVSAEAERMALARRARGFEARSVRAWPVLARSTGVLFVRSYERGERVHLAMMSRGYRGRLPALEDPGHGVAAPGWWVAALPLAVSIILFGSRVMVS